MKNSFFLVIPVQDNNALRLKEFEEKALQQWIDELPTANPGLATRLIHDFLTRFNSIEMPFQLRLDSLEIIRPSVLVIEDYLRSKLISIGFPKNDEDKRNLAILVAIEKEFTIGYWTVLKELTRRRIGWFQGKNVALGIQRCIKGLGSIVVSNFIMGMPIPDWVWIDLHSLYKLSVKLNKDTVKVANEPSNPIRASSPEESYQQILLLSLAEPTGLMQKEIQLVYNFIETLGVVLELKNAPVSNQKLQCVILADEDKPPQFQPESNAKADDPAKVYVDLAKLYKTIRQKDKLTNKAESRFSSVHVLKSKAMKPSVELLDYLEKRWQGMQLQSTPFFTDRLDRYLAVGFEATYKLQAAVEPSNSLELEYLVHSESDRSLSCSFDRSGVLSVGSLVSFRRNDMPEYKRSLGIVNEIVVAKQSDKISFGIQLLARQSIIVSYTQLDAPGHAPSHRALLYSMKDEAGEKSYIITDTPSLNDNDIIRMLMGNEVFPVALNNKKNIGLGYWQFECRRIMDMGKLPQAR